MTLFKDRVEAGRLLVRDLKELKGKEVVVLAIPRGGVIVANEVARALKSPLDLIIPRKVGAPGNPELAIGAVTQDGAAIIDKNTVRMLGVNEKYLEDEVKSQVEEVRRRMKKYRGERPYPKLKDKVVVLVDDGVATGYTMRAAIQSVRRQSPSSIWVAVPVGPPESIEELSREADRVVCLRMPEPFFAIGQFYERFEQVEDEELLQILEEYSVQS